MDRLTIGIYLLIIDAVRRKADQLIPFEIAVLQTAVTLQRRGETTFHGYSLAKAIKTAADTRTLTAHGTLYRALHRLENAGLLEGFWEDPVDAAGENRPRRRLYRLTALAEVALARAGARQRKTRGLRPLKARPETR